MIQIDISEITILITATFSAILTVIILVCYSKKILHLFDFFPSSYGKDKKDKNC